MLLSITFVCQESAKKRVEEVEVSTMWEKPLFNNGRGPGKGRAAPDLITERSQLQGLVLVRCGECSQDLHIVHKLVKGLA